jgi:hypothetical protein
VDELIRRLTMLSKRSLWCLQEDFDAQSFSGGNFDDAYEGGYADGEASLAQEILETISPLDFKEELPVGQFVFLHPEHPKDWTAGIFDPETEMIYSNLYPLSVNEATYWAPLPEVPHES